MRHTSLITLASDDVQSISCADGEDLRNVMREETQSFLDS